MRLFLFSTLLLLMTTLFSGCLSQNDQKKNKSEHDLSSINTDYSFTNVIMENDTLDKKLEKGVINFFYKIHDTIKLSPKDERRIYVEFSLIPHNENKNMKEIEDGIKIKKNLSFIPVNSRDTISIPFTIEPHFSGKGVILGGLLDIYKIHKYDDEKVRVLTYENIFEKDVYIK